MNYAAAAALCARSAKSIFQMREKRRIFLVIAGVAVSAAFLAHPFATAVSAQTREDLEAELKKIEEQIAVYEKELATTKVQKKTLANKISQLKKEQEKISLQIKATNLQIRELGKELSSTHNLIQKRTEELNVLKERTAGILRAIDEENRKTIVEILLAERGFSLFFSSLEASERLSERLTSAVRDVKGVKRDLETRYSDLETKQGEKKNLLAIQNLQQQNLVAKTGEQNKLLKDTQGKEARYQTSLADSKKKAQEIRNRIYELLGVGRQITFGEAVEIAGWVSRETGVRPALLLAVLTQESNLGKNVGICNRPGDPPSKSWKAVMKPDRDQEPFLAIIKELNRDADITPVSCPMRDAAGNRIGWGGAMGPAQFIPSTWVLYKDKVSALTGRNPANPWDIRDAFVAAALLLRDNGAGVSGSDAEWRAAMLYFSGSTNLKFRFYGDNVIALAKKYEEDMKDLG
jgi:peptidoglycan hydrolase CwlO-like protein